MGNTSTRSKFNRAHREDSTLSRIHATVLLPLSSSTQLAWACGHSSPHLCRSVAVQAAVLVAEFNPKLSPPKSTVDALGRLVRPPVSTAARRLTRRPCSLMHHDLLYGHMCSSVTQLIPRRLLCVRSVLASGSKVDCC